MDNSFFDRILVPTDLSECSAAALRYAVAIRRKIGSQVTVFYAQEPQLAFDVTAFPMSDSLASDSRTQKELLDVVCQWARRYAPDIMFDARVAFDTAARAIVHAANDLHADVTFMGTHGRHGLKRALLGSVTEGVLRETDRPVLTVAPAVPATGDITIERILCPVNFTPIARQSLKHAADVAASLGAELMILYVAEPGVSRPLSLAGPEMAAWIAPVVNDRIRYREVTIEGDAVARILEVTDEMRADMVVIGAQHKLFGDTAVLGMTTERITRSARVPVMTVHVRAPQHRRAQMAGAERDTVAVVE